MVINFSINTADELMDLVGRLRAEGATSIDIGEIAVRFSAPPTPQADSQGEKDLKDVKDVLGDEDAEPKSSDILADPDLYPGGRVPSLPGFEADDEE